MPTDLKRVSFYATAEQAAWLDAETERTGAPVSEVCRRAILTYQYMAMEPDSSLQAFMKKRGLEGPAPAEQRQPVLLVTKKAGE
jgi:hypothetical protein